MIPIVVGAIGTVSNGLKKKLGEQETREKISTIQTAALEYLEESRKPEVTCCHRDFSEKSPDGKKLQRVQ